MPLLTGAIYHRFLCAAGVTALLVSSLAADWTHCRGSDSTGVCSGDAVPLHFGRKQHLAWQADLPGRGLSSPVLVGNRVFLTASSGQRQNRLHAMRAYATQPLVKAIRAGLGFLAPAGMHPIAVNVPRRYRR